MDELFRTYLKNHSLNVLIQLIKVTYTTNLEKVETLNIFRR